MLDSLTLPRRRPTRVATGLTLIELLVTMAIVAILLAIALPSMRDFVARKRMEGIAQELATDMRYIKSYQVQNRVGGTGIDFNVTATKSCYVVYIAGGGFPPFCNCALAPDARCGNAALPVSPVALRQVDIPLSTGITMTADTRRLVVTSHSGLPSFNRTISVTLASETAGTIRISTNPTGVPAICSESGSFSAIKACAP